MIKKIDETETSVESSLTTVKLKRSFTPTLNVALSYTLNYSNELFEIAGAASISSNQFTHKDDSGVLRTDCSLQDSNGIMQVFRTLGASRVTVANNVGTVTYNTGKIALTTFAPVTISDG